MSTFDGCVEEFPDIRIDYFRPARKTRERVRPPLAYFLSHVHTDHTEGLESCKSPFIYCSSATREILLRLEKWPHRMNFAKGILESRVQHFRHLKKLLKPLPLETPTEIDLAPGNSIRVTLFDANHCIGSVMFLIEGDGKAVLYTGDIRSEAWWVNSLTRNPLLIPYVSFNRKRVKQLDKIYLDTTFVATGKEGCHNYFPPKADGLAELLHQVSAYPPDTVFHFDAWTFGYEEVWQALSAFLNSRVHLDDYRFGIYTALAHGQSPQAPEVPTLIGFHLGNHFKKGFITSAPSRLHSCEKSAGCVVFKQGMLRIPHVEYEILVDQTDFVRITPIIARYQGQEIVEAGAGGGKGDLDLRHELDTDDMQAVMLLIGFCMAKLQDQPEVMNDVKKLLNGVISARRSAIPLDLTALYGQGKDGEGSTLHALEELPLEKLVPLLAAVVDQNKTEGSTSAPDRKQRADGLPTQITFPYSRHSSYEELCHLIQAFQPLDIFPCTSIPPEHWSERCSMSVLFGHLYKVNVVFSHDDEMFKQKAVARGYPPISFSSSTENESQSHITAKKRKAHERVEEGQDAPRAEAAEGRVDKQQTPPTCLQGPGMAIAAADLQARVEPQSGNRIQTPKSSQARRRQAWKAALSQDGTTWSSTHLSSTSAQEQREDEL